MSNQEEKIKEKNSEKKIPKKSWYRSFINFFTIKSADLTAFKAPSFYIINILLYCAFFFSFKTIVFSQEIINFISYLFLIAILIILSQAFYFLKRKNLLNFFTWFQVNSWMIVMSLFLLFWYAVIWSQAGDKKIEAFNGLISALAFFGIIGTIIVQIYQHTINQRREMKQLRIQYLMEKIALCRLTLKEKRQEVNDDLNKGFDSPDMSELAKEVKYEKYQNEEGLKKEILSCFAYHTQIICYQSELDSLVPTFYDKKVISLHECGHNFIKRLNSLAIDKKVTSEEFNRRCDEFSKDFMNYYTNN